MKIAQGAEAVIEQIGENIIKHRLPKDYRHPLIDDKLRKFRTKREAKVLGKLNDLGFATPILNSMDSKEMKINMEFVNGPKVRDVLDENYPTLAAEIGKKVAFLHTNNIIHGDLTTSNMILDKEIKFIDFGLSFFSTKEEDKAVDLHLLRRALESKHHKVFEDCFELILKSYKENYEGSTLVLNRFEKVQNRGRNKSKH